MYLITLSGIDSAGKSTQIAKLNSYLQGQGRFPLLIWSRGGYTGGFSALKALLRRLRPGLIPPPGHSSQRELALNHSPVRRLWLWLALLDLIRLYALNIRWWRRGRTVICDRYLWDTLIDFRLNFLTENVETWRLWRWLVHLAPRPDLSVLLVIPVEESLRRSQAKADPFLEQAEKCRRRYEQYRQLQLAGCWPVVIDATRPVEEVWETLRTALPAELRKETVW